MNHGMKIPKTEIFLPVPVVHNVRIKILYVRSQEKIGGCEKEVKIQFLQFFHFESLFNYAVFSQVMRNFQK